MQLKNIFFSLNLQTWRCCQPPDYYTISTTMKCVPLNPGRCYCYYIVTFSIMLLGFYSHLSNWDLSKSFIPFSLSFFFLFLKNIGEMGGRLHNLSASYHFLHSETNSVWEDPGWSPGDFTGHTWGCQAAERDRCREPWGRVFEHLSWGLWPRLPHPGPSWIAHCVPENSSSNYLKNYRYWAEMFPPNLFFFFWPWVGRAF